MNIQCRTFVFRCILVLCRLIKFCFQLFYKHIQFMQVDVCQNRRNNTSLRCSRVRFVVAPVFQITRSQNLV